MSRLDRESVRRVSPLEEVIPQLVGESLRGNSGEPAVRCPFHEDTHPSLRINAQRQVWRCDPCDVGGDVFAFVRRFNKCSFPEALSFLGERYGVEPDSEPGPTQPRSSSPSGSWIYHRPDGSEAFKVERFEEASGKKRFRQAAPDGSDGWICKRGCMDGVERWLYRVEHLRGRDTVCLVEGEKIVDAMRTLGIPATTTPGGAGKWHTSDPTRSPIGLGGYAAQFMDAGIKNVAILPDNDDPGRQYAEDAALACHAAGLQVKVVTLPGLPPKGDVVDFLEAGGTKADLRQAIQDAPRYAPPAPADGGTRDDTETAPVTLAALLNDIEGFIRRFVVLSDDQAVAVTLWTAHTRAIDAFDCTPYLQITSATARTGKTRLLEVSELLVARPWLTGRTSAAALVRKVDAESPTLLLDESDAAFGGEREYAEALRGILNSGYRRSGRTTLCVGQGANLTFRDFATFGAKAIAGIGTLPSTVADRSITIKLKRRKSDEPVERFNERAARAQAKPIRAELEAWGGGAVPTLRAARPSLPESLNDRAQDVWEPLLAIGDLAGGTWPERARRAAEALMGEVSDDDINVELLHDIRTVFDDTSATFIGSTELVAKLADLDSRPWGDWKKGKAITTRAVADRLRTFGIVPKPNAQATARGYHRDRFEDAWTRYSPCPPPDQTVNPSEHQ